MVYPYLLPGFGLPRGGTVHLITRLEDGGFELPALVFWDGEDVLLVDGEQPHTKHTPGLKAHAAGCRAAGPLRHLPSAHGTRNRDQVIEKCLFFSFNLSILIKKLNRFFSLLFSHIVHKTLELRCKIDFIWVYFLNGSIFIQLFYQCVHSKHFSSNVFFHSHSQTHILLLDTSLTGLKLK